MIARRVWIIALWTIGLAAAMSILVHARYLTDLSVFLPAKPTPAQELLADQLRDGIASRLLLIAIEGGNANTRSQICLSMAHRLRLDQKFFKVDDGEPLSAERDREFLFRHRYLLSDAITAERFSIAGLRAAIGETIENLTASTGLMLKSLMPHDPTGEMLRIVDRLARTEGPQTKGGVWISADGARTLLAVQTAAAGSDTDAQERAQKSIREAFTAAATTAAGSGAAVYRLEMSGPGVFAVTGRANIRRAALRLSLISGFLVIAVLLAVYRSLSALILGLLPVASGALIGIAAVALVFGSVHGITLAFGITLIGESVDYSIYFFIQSSREKTAAGTLTWRRRLWPTIRLGMFTSVCGFASLLPSGFPGLAQLGLYSISGLIAAGLVTRYILPELLPRSFRIRDVAPLGLKIGRLRDSVRARHLAVASMACLIAAVALLVLYRHHDTLWNRELASLNPIPAADLRRYATLRADLHAADAIGLVVVSGPSLETVLRGAERAAITLQSLTDDHVIGGFDSPADFLPSAATQQARRAALPEKQLLRHAVRLAAAGLDIDGDRLSPFIDDVDVARQESLLTARDLRGTSLAAGFDALIVHRSDHWSALLPLHPAPGEGAVPRDIDIARVGAALTAARLDDTQILDLKAQTDALYAGYLHEAIRLSCAGFALIVLLLLIALRSLRRVARVLAPLCLAVLAVAAGIVGCGRQLTLLHLVGMLLIVAVGSNYALFFDQEGTGGQEESSPLILASLLVANISTVIGFGLLSVSRVPVLEALGTTVASGAFLGLLFCALMTSRTGSGRRGGADLAECDQERRIWRSRTRHP